MFRDHPYLCIVAALSALCLSSIAVVSELHSDPSAPVFFSRTSLVLVPTVVTDKMGNHLTGLTRGDFQILEDNKDERIAIFEETNTSSGAIRRVDPNDAGFSNVVAPDSKAQRLTLIVLDTLNTRFADQVHARRELVRFIDETLQPGEAVAILTIGSNGLSVVNDFTTDPKVLSAAVKKVRSEPSQEERIAPPETDPPLSQRLAKTLGYGPRSLDEIADKLDEFQGAAFDRFEQLQQANNVEITLMALRQIAESFAGIPGRKSLILATGGLPFITDDPTSFSFRTERLLAAYESTWSALNHAQIAVYPLDMGGLFNPGFVSARFGKPVHYRRMVDSVGNLETMARKTGGRRCEYKMSLSGCFSASLKDESQYYLLGYYSDSSKGRMGWRKLDVSTHRANAVVEARDGYYVSPKPHDAKKAASDDMNVAITSPVDFTSVPMLVRWTGRTAQGVNTRLSFRFNVPGTGFTIDRTNQNEISLAFAAFAKVSANTAAGEFVKDLEGKLSDETVENIIKQGIVYDGALDVPAGKYSVRFIVRDNLSGRIGTVTVPLEVEKGATTTSTVTSPAQSGSRPTVQ